MKKELLIAALGIGFTGALDAATQQEIEQLLNKLAKTPVRNQARGAYCYAPMSPPPNRITYVCPVCGTKTLYVRKKENSSVENLHTYRERCETLRKLGWEVKLDESFLCSKCRDPRQEQYFFIEVTIDGKTTRTKMYGYDLNMLVAFAEKKLYWQDYGPEKPLKPELPRLRKLLGVSEKEQKSSPLRIRKLFGIFEEKPTETKPTAKKSQ